MNNSKVIFLDIDGVIQIGWSQLRFDHDLKALKQEFITKDPFYETISEYDLGAVLYDWDLEVVERIRKLCADNDAIIVISSDWRTSKNLKQLQYLFKIHDLDKYVVNAIGPLDEKGRFQGLNSREIEVQKYLDTHPEIEKYVLIDDLNYSSHSEEFKKNFILCRSHLTQELYEQANEILR